MAPEAFPERASGVELLDARLDVAKAAVYRRQFRAKAEDGDIDGLAADLAKAFFGRFHEAPAETGALMSGVHGQHAEIAAGNAKLDIDTGEDCAGGIFRDEDTSLFHHGCKMGIVGPCRFEKLLHRESGVDKRDQARPIG